ncbi:aspartic proteinase 36-like [Impatiens glandulifera]|uniref:aspartic proteinase 36-like n=1 Tax=Impatiens glandulifera TaxID=253017 RepID=UPI001FB06134|nr:aspartic proteinase 36-like [Impatiens glandulifera]
MLLDLSRERRFALLGLLMLVLQVIIGRFSFVSANLVLKVQHRFSGKGKSLGDYWAHDVRRHGRILAVDIPLGGDGNPTDTALYYTKIGLGTPPTDYYVQVDTGSDILWVNCIGCDKCPRKSDLGIELRLYDPQASSTGKEVTCDQDFCSTANDDQTSCKAGTICPYSVSYGDGSSTSGYYVRDNVQLDRASGDLSTTPMSGTIAFGCGNRQSGQLGSSSEALDGIIGFGQANSSMLSQLASTGKVKKSFAHCLDGNNGGGIFAIGEVVQPKLNTVPLIPNQPHYNVNLKSIEVGDSVLSLPSSFGSNSERGAIIDSGTTLAYLPDSVYNPLMDKITSSQPDLKLRTIEQQFTCFKFSEDVDSGFPAVKFNFENSLSMTIYPREYLFKIRDDVWCFGWMSSGTQTRDGKDLILLGDMVLSNKLVLYDLENQALGWTEYNCSSSIKVKDEATGAVYEVGYHRLSLAYISAPGWLITLWTLSFSLIYIGFTK